MTLSSKLIELVFGPSFHSCWGPLERPLAICLAPFGIPKMAFGWAHCPPGLWEGLWARFGLNLDGLWEGPLPSGKVSGPDLDPIWNPKLSILGSHFGPETLKEDMENDYWRHIVFICNHIKRNEREPITLSMNIMKSVIHKIRYWKGRRQRRKPINNDNYYGRP